MKPSTSVIFFSCFLISKLTSLMSSVCVSHTALSIKALCSTLMCFSSCGPTVFHTTYKVWSIRRAYTKSGAGNGQVAIKQQAFLH